MASISETSRFKCSTCAGNNISTDAVQYCLECQDYYCSACIDLHNKFPLMRGHSFLNKEDFDQSGKSKTTIHIPTDRCSLHKARLLDMWCGKHDQVACALCIVLNHSTCGDIHCIPEEIDELCKNSSRESTKQRLSNNLAQLKTIKKTMVNLIDTLKKNKITAMESIKTFRQAMEAILEKLENKSIEHVEETYEKKAATLNKKLKEMEAYIELMEGAEEKFNNACENRGQDFVSIKTAENLLAQTENLSKNNLNASTNVDIIFIPDTKTQEMFKGLTTLGEVCIGALKKEINVKLINEQRNNCYIFGSCFIKTGSLLLADFNNRRLKRMNMSTGAIDYLDVQENPHSVCCISPEEAAITQCNSQVIQFVSLKDDKMEATRQLNLDHNCFCVAYRDHKLFITETNRNVLYIYDMNGTKLQEIPLNFSHGKVHVSSSVGKLFVTCNNINHLTILDLQGKHLSTFKDPNNKHIHCCAYGKGYIFVCGVNQSSVLQIDENTMSKLKVIDKASNGCSSVCFDPQQNQLVVTHSYSDTITVYELDL